MSLCAVPSRACDHPSGGAGAAVAVGVMEGCGGASCGSGSRAAPERGSCWEPSHAHLSSTRKL